MFFGPLKEQGDVRIDGVNSAAFQEFLQFFYVQQVKFTTENVADVIDLGHKYNVSKCMDLCVDFLKDTLTDDNICNGLSLALFYNLNELKKFCEKRIITNTSGVLKSASFLECKRTILKEILNINLFSCPELEIFDACMSWVKAASKQDVLTKELIKTHLGDLFYAIRFASMKMKDVANLTGPYGFLFSFDEYKDIIQMIELPTYQAKIFNSKPRELPWNKDAIIVCDRSIPNRPNTFSRSMKRVEATAFSTNEPVLLGSLICTSLVDQREKKSPNSRSKQLVEVIIVEISGVDIPDDDQDDESLPEIFNNQVNEPVFTTPLRAIQSEQPTVAPTGNIERNVVMRTAPPIPAPLEPDDTEDDEEEEDEPQDQSNADNDDDYDLIFEKTISSLKVFLRSKSRTKILLSKPVLIRPGFLYEIRVQQTPYKHFYNAKLLKTKVQLESDITIRFHSDSLHNIKRYGLITGLEFNRI